MFLTKVPGRVSQQGRGRNIRTDEKIVTTAKIKNPAEFHNAAGRVIQSIYESISSQR